MASTSKPQPQKLPLSEKTAYFHGLRVHLQIIQWVTLDLICLDAENWGWSFENNTYSPIMTDIPPAPENLLLGTRCICQYLINVCFL